MDNIMNNYDIRKNARENLKGNWGAAIGTQFVLSLCVIPFSIVLGILSSQEPFPIAPYFIIYLITLLISSAIKFGIANFYLNFKRSKRPIFEEAFKGFKNIFKVFGALFIVSLITFLWTLLLIIPGIIASFNYSQVFYILADNEDITIFEAMKESKRIMNGKKWQLFILGLSFIGWYILACLTCGIGFFWLIQYYYMSLTEFYDYVCGYEEPQNDLILENK